MLYNRNNPAHHELGEKSRTILFGEKGKMENNLRGDNEIWSFTEKMSNCWNFLKMKQLKDDRLKSEF